jgi:hypothetical protein
MAVDIGVALLFKVRLMVLPGDGQGGTNPCLGSKSRAAGGAPGVQPFITMLTML